MSGEDHFRSSSWRNVFTYSLQGLKSCPFDWSTMMRLGAAAAASNDARHAIPITIRNFNAAFTFRHPISRSRRRHTTIGISSGQSELNIHHGRDGGLHEFTPQPSI